MKASCPIAPRFFLFLAAFFALSPACRSTVERIPAETLRAHLDDPSWIVIDTRLDTDWTAAEGRIPGAHREEPLGVADWARKYPRDRTIVTYCA